MEPSLALSGQAFVFFLGEVVSQKFNLFNNKVLQFFEKHLLESKIEDNDAII